MGHVVTGAPKWGATMLTMLTVPTQERALCGEHSVQKHIHDTAIVPGSAALFPSLSSPCRMCWPACRFAGMEESQVAEMT
jgi:hypothetical protein